MRRIKEEKTDKQLDNFLIDYSLDDILASVIKYSHSVLNAFEIDIDDIHKVQDSLARTKEIWLKRRVK